MTFLLRYVWCVTPHFARAAVLTLLVGIGGIWMVLVFPDDHGAPYVPLLFVQMFTAASGFRPSADRGWFDALLVRYPNRGHLALAHWFWSTAPGATAWMTTACAERLLGDTGAQVGWSVSGIVALWLVSCVSWAVTLPGAAYAGGVAWTVVMVSVGVFPRGVSWVREAVFETAATDLAGLVSAMAALVACPFLLLVPSVQVTSQPVVLIGVGAVGSLALVLGICWIRNRNYPGLS